MNNILDVAKLTATIRGDTKMLAARLQRAGLTNQVKSIYTEHKGLVDIAAALIKLARKGPDSLAREEAIELSSELKLLEQIEDRKAAGGHPAFDLKVSAAARECWTHLDAATTLFSAALLLDGIVDDPVYGSRPTVKSVLRPVLETPPPPKKRKRTKKADGSKQKKAAGGQNGSSQQNPSPPAPPSVPPAVPNPGDPSSKATPDDKKPS